ncbi:hypothetical protein, partial [Gluconacetobacter sacchari]|uniref:hypothetical protein n=1 Tax=Gluconacetobacter sacchari TaxID=92759 RepID=UPI001C7EEC26
GVIGETDGFDTQFVNPIKSLGDTRRPISTNPVNKMGYRRGVAPVVVKQAQTMDPKRGVKK